jgi:heparin/heparan-sulfate lyase
MEKLSRLGASGGLMFSTGFEPGAWRIEVSPWRAAAEDHFLTGLQTTQWPAPARLPVQRLENADRAGCVITGPDGSWVVWLRKDNQRSATPVRVAVDGPAARCHFLVTDLSAGRWEARREGSEELTTFDASADAGAGWFEGRAGTWVLTPGARPGRG